MPEEPTLGTILTVVKTPLPRDGMTDPDIVIHILEYWNTIFMFGNDRMRHHPTYTLLNDIDLH